MGLNRCMVSWVVGCHGSQSRKCDKRFHSFLQQLRFKKKKGCWILNSRNVNESNLLKGGGENLSSRVWDAGHWKPVVKVIYCKSSLPVFRC